jgi:hypothetical protein
MSYEGQKDVDYIFDQLVGGGHLWQWKTTAVGINHYFSSYMNLLKIQGGG